MTAPAEHLGCEKGRLSPPQGGSRVEEGLNASAEVCTVPIGATAGHGVWIIA